MSYVNDAGYLERLTKSSKCSRSKASRRDWWLVKCNSHKMHGLINVQKISLPRRFVGKRVRFKLEVMP